VSYAAGFSQGLGSKKKPSSQPYIIPASQLNSPAKTTPEAGSSALEASSPSTATETVSLDAETPSPETAPQVIPSTSESLSESPSVESVHTKNPAQKTSTTSPPRPQIDIPLDSGHKGVSSLSLKSIAQKKKIEENQEVTQPDKGVKRNSEITHKAFLEAWNQYAENIKNEGKFNLHSHLTMGVPQLKGTEITLIYPNDTIRLEVEREQGDILMHLANTLNNDHLSFNLVVEEQAVKRYAYTPEEKYEQLKTENPLLEVLRGSLDLDL
jgi:DNA polymerase-3 subunit gamma/tau